MSPVNINSLISSTISVRPGSVQPTIQPPGQLPGHSRVGPLGDTFTQGEPWKNRATSKGAESGNDSPLVYTRVAAAGKGKASQDSSQTETPQVAYSGAQNSSEQNTEEVSGKPTDEKQAQSAAQPTKINGEPLSQSEVALLGQLKKADQSVRAHERAHIAAAGGYAKGGASYSFKRGPDGKNYAVGGEVQIDISAESSPEATIQKMQTVRRAALAPADPSPQDQRVAAQATIRLAESLKQLSVDDASSPSITPQKASDQSENKSAQDVYQEYGQSFTGTIPKETKGGNVFVSNYKQNNTSSPGSAPINGFEMIA